MHEILRDYLSGLLTFEEAVDALRERYGLSRDDAIDYVDSGILIGDPRSSVRRAGR